MSILTPLQVAFIKEFSVSPLQKNFFLTGGTALSEFYLQHRYSEDMDFFTEEEGIIGQTIPRLQHIARKLKSRLDVVRSFETFLEIVIVSEEARIRCDFALDSPFRLKDKILHPTLGILVDNELDIACNKLSALYDRSDCKDFVDIYFLDREFLPFQRLLEAAKKKHIGLDDYWLAISMAKIENFDLLPRMIKPVTFEELKAFFVTKSNWLIEKNRA